MKTQEIGTERSWSFILKAVHFIIADVQITHQIVFYFLWQILFWMFSLTNQAPIDISWQRIETVIAYKQSIPDTLEWYLLDSIWAHPVAVTAFSHLWLQRQSERNRICQFGNFNKLSEDTWKSSKIKEENTRQMAVAGGVLGVPRYGTAHLHITSCWSRSSIPFNSQVIRFHSCPLWNGLSYLHPTSQPGSDFQRG